ncbi:unnamed protein product [Closterium sp. NIES-65]|nr:unnamed protein product [Closterium sp. NIES-65]
MDTSRWAKMSPWRRTAMDPLTSPLLGSSPGRREDVRREEALRHEDHYVHDSLAFSSKAASCMGSLAFSIKQGSFLYGEVREGSDKGLCITRCSVTRTTLSPINLPPSRPSSHSQHYGHDSLAFSIKRGGFLNREHYVHDSLAFSIKRGGFLYGEVLEDSDQGGSCLMICSITSIFLHLSRPSLSQHYVHDSLAFSIKRGGFLFGEVREDGHVLVDFIYEPPQHGTEHTLQIFSNEGGIRHIRTSKGREDGHVLGNFRFEPPQHGTEHTLQIFQNEAEERAVAAIAAGLGMRSEERAVEAIAAGLGMRSEERAVAAIAAGLGMRCVGFIVTQTLAEDQQAQEHSFTLSASDLLLSARLHCATARDSSGGKGGGEGEASAGGTADAGAQAGGRGNGDGAAGGEGGEKKGEEEGGEPFKYFAIVLVKLLVDEEGDGGGDVHFEAFQLSDQCLKLYREGWFAGDGKGEEEEGGGGGGRDKGKGKVGEKEKGKSGEKGEKEEEKEVDPKVSRMRKEVVVAGRDTKEVDNDFFLMPIKIVDHQGPLTTSFPVENRVILPTQNDLKQHLDRTRSKPWADRLADFHLLLYLSNFLDASTDMPMLAQAVRTKEPISEGHQLIIEHLA